MKGVIQFIWAQKGWHVAQNTIVMDHTRLETRREEAGSSGRGKLGGVQPIKTFRSTREIVATTSHLQLFSRYIYNVQFRVVNPPFCV